jgi:hypothetical protein
LEYNGYLVVSSEILFWRDKKEIADEEQRSISQICELFLKGAVEDYKKDGPQFVQRLLARQKHKAKA